MEPLLYKPYLLSVKISESCILSIQFYCEVKVLCYQYYTSPLRRTGGCTSIPVKFTEGMTLTLKKDLFLNNKERKQAFIKMLGKELQSFGLRVFHADYDADVLIVKKAIEISQTAKRLLLEMILTYLFFYFISPETLNLSIFSFIQNPRSLRGKSPSLSRSNQLSGNLVWNCVKIFSLYKHCLDATQSLVYLELEKALY